MSSNINEIIGDGRQEGDVEKIPLKDMNEIVTPSFSDIPLPQGVRSDQINLDDLEEKMEEDSNATTSRWKNNLSFVLSVFNLMNAILGSGILGLAETLKNVGVIPFIVMMASTGLLGSYTINMLLHMTQLVGVKTYENLSERAFGKVGKIITTVIILIHCLGALCSYLFIVKEELPEFVKAVTATPESNFDAWYYNEVYLMLLLVAVVILPLASMKKIDFLGYSSGFAMLCMLFFTITVVIKKFTIPCPLPAPNTTMEVHHNTTTMHNTTHEEEETEQTCEAELFTINSRSAYSLPTMFFSFMCHASMLSIYAELKSDEDTIPLTYVEESKISTSPSIKRMQKVANVSILLVLIIYISAALFGYLTFFSEVESELLLTYSRYNAHDPLIILARCMVITCVTLSFPLLHYPARKTIIVTFLKNPTQFKWIRHLVIMVIFISTSVLLVVYIPDIRDIFGFAGATSSTTLLIIFPSLFVIRLTGPSKASPHIQKLYRKRRIFSYFLCTFGVVFMLMSTGMMVMDHVTSKSSH